MALCLKVKDNEIIKIGKDVTIKVKKAGSSIQVSIEAPKEIFIQRILNNDKRRHI